MATPKVQQRIQPARTQRPNQRPGINRNANAQANNGAHSLEGAEFEAPPRELALGSLDAMGERGSDRRNQDRGLRRKLEHAQERASGGADKDKGHRLRTRELASSSRAQAQNASRHQKKARIPKRLDELAHEIGRPDPRWDEVMVDIIPQLMATMLNRPITIADPQAEGGRQMRRIGVSLAGSALGGAPIELARSGAGYVSARADQKPAPSRETGASSFYAAVLAQLETKPARAGGAQAGRTAEGLRSELASFVKKLARATPKQPAAMKARRAVFNRLASRELRSDRNSTLRREVGATTPGPRETFGAAIADGAPQRNLERDRLINQVKSRVRNHKHARTRLKRIAGDKAMLKLRIKNIQGKGPLTAERRGEIAALQEKLNRLGIEETAIKQWQLDKRKPAAARSNVQKATAVQAELRGVIEGGVAKPGRPKAGFASKLRLEGAVAKKKLATAKEMRRTVLEKVREVPAERAIQNAVDKIMAVARELKLVPDTLLGQARRPGPPTAKLVDDGQLARRLAAAAA